MGGPFGGWVSDAFGWRWAFIVQIPLLFIAAALVYTQVRVPAPNTPTSKAGIKGETTFRSKLARIDYLGSLTLVIAVGALLLSMSLKTSSTKSDGSEYLWSDPIVYGLLITSGIMTIVFVLVEKYYSPEPILPLQLLTRRTPVAVALSSLIMVLNQFSMMYNIPLFFSAVLLTSSSVAGAHLLPYSFLMGVGSLAAGWFMRRTGTYWWISIICGVMMVISSVMLCTWNRESPGWITWVSQMPSGFGYTGVLTSTIVALMTHVTRQGKGET